MQSRLIACAGLVATLLLVRSSHADDPTTTHHGKKIANLAFTDADGKTTHLYDLKDKKAIVLVFLSFECPVSTSYAQPLADMHKEYAKHGVAFIGLTTNEDETPAQVAKQARHYNLPFPVYLDAKLSAANALKAQI